MIYYYSLIHLFFVFLGIYAWFSIDRKRDYKKYIKLSLIIGLPLGLIFDFLLSGVFNFFSYSSKNIFEYLAILLCTYVAGAPFLIEIPEFLIEKLKLIRFDGLKKLTSDFYYTETLISGILLGALFIYALINILYPQDILLFILVWILLIFFSDGLLGIHNEEGVITKILKGYYFAPLGLIASGILCGIIWEILNLNIRLWTFFNLPGDSIWGIPIIELLLWSTLNLVYWTTAKVVSKYIKF